MTRDQALAWLKELGVKVPAAQQRGRWVVSDCPLGPWRHSGGSSGPDVFGVRVEAGESFCYCFACDFHGDQTDLLLVMKALERHSPSGKEYSFGRLLQLIALAEETAELAGLDSPDIEEVLFGKDAGPHFFPQWWLDTFVPWREAPFARAYLDKRGVDHEVADFLDVRADSTEMRVCFPVRDFSGRLVGMHGRVVLPDVEPRYRMYNQGGRNNPQFWLGEQWLDMSLPIVAVEGPMDLASVRRVYHNVASPLFSNPNETKLRRIGAATEVVTFLDRGTGGDKGRAKYDRVLGGSLTVRHVMPPGHRKDPGVCTVDELREALQDLVPLL